jgi:parallel beta-helix repeat protein
VYDNLCVGVWIDIDCKGVTIERNLIENNAADGIRYEISYDGIIRNNACVNNDFYVGRNKGTNLYYGGGINVHTSSNVDVYGNTVADNLNGIGLVRTNRGTGDYGVWDLVDVTVHDNTITMSSGVSGLRQNVGDDTYYTGKGNGFQDNTYYLDDFSAERFWWMNGVRTRDEWTAYGQDTTGAFYLIE